MTADKFIATSGAAATHSIWSDKIAHGKSEKEHHPKLNAEQLLMLKQATNSDSTASSLLVCQKCS